MKILLKTMVWGPDGGSRYHGHYSISMLQLHMAKNEKV